MLLNILLAFSFTLCMTSCGNKASFQNDEVSTDDNAVISAVETSEKEVVLYKEKALNTKNTSPEELVKFAKTLIGVPYLYGSTNPKKGFDCSGFITYVFNHFQIKVP
jgi:cell wall-associated NlpC family hydrolase